VYYILTNNKTMTDTKKLTDEDLIEEVRLNDKEVFAIVIERYEDKLLRYAKHLVTDEHKAVDIVQESFIKAYINLNSFSTTKKFSSWIYRIVHNQAMNVVKKYNKETPLLDNIDYKSDENIEKEFEQKETIDKVRSCLNQIPIIYSEPLNLFYVEEKSYEEISDILQIPIGTVATRISRAKIIMKKICLTN